MQQIAFPLPGDQVVKHYQQRIIYAYYMYSIFIYFYRYGKPICSLYALEQKAEVSREA